MGKSLDLVLASCPGDLADLALRKRSSNTISPQKGSLRVGGAYLGACSAGPLRVTLGLELSESGGPAAASKPHTARGKYSSSCGGHT